MNEVQDAGTVPARQEQETYEALCHKVIELAGELQSSSNPVAQAAYSWLLWICDVALPTTVPSRLHAASLIEEGTRDIRHQDLRAPLDRIVALLRSNYGSRFEPLNPR